MILQYIYINDNDVRIINISFVEDVTSTSNLQWIISDTVIKENTSIYVAHYQFLLAFW